MVPKPNLYYNNRKTYSMSTAVQSAQSKSKPQPKQQTLANSSLEPLNHIYNYITYSSPVYGYISQSQS